MFGIDDAIAAGLQVFDKFIPDPQAKAEAEAALRESLQKWDAAQTEVNKIEAGNSNVFAAALSDAWIPNCDVG